MKVSIVLTDGAKQVMLTPETEHEKMALKMIAPTDTLKAVSKWGIFCGGEPKHMGMQVAQCHGGYYRMFPEAESLMFVIEEEKNERTRGGDCQGS